MREHSRSIVGRKKECIVFVHMPGLAGKATIRGLTSSDPVPADGYVPKRHFLLYNCTRSSLSLDLAVQQALVGTVCVKPTLLFPGDG